MHCTARLNLRRQPAAHLLLVLALMGPLTAAGCTHDIQVSKQMTWECAPEHYMRDYPQAQPVRFRFVEDPTFEDVISGKGLCDQLKASRKKVVVMEFDTWGNSVQGLIGFREVSVEGKPIIDVGGWGSISAHGVGTHPLAKLYPKIWGGKASVR